MWEVWRSHCQGTGPDTATTSTCFSAATETTTHGSRHSMHQSFCTCQLFLSTGHWYNLLHSSPLSSNLSLVQPLWRMKVNRNILIFLVVSDEIMVYVQMQNWESWVEYFPKNLILMLGGFSVQDPGGVQRMCTILKVLLMALSQMSSQWLSIVNLKLILYVCELNGMLAQPSSSVQRVSWLCQRGYEYPGSHNSRS